uniref:E4 protein n=1 Tax=Human papillomavirus TaxID=10566 RepID=A0A3R5X7F2_9PAPI|nr:MAG: E4 protein [Human papillomavirus]
MVIELIIFYLKRILVDMVILELGLLIIKINKFFPLLPAQLGGLFLVPPRNSVGNQTPPKPKRKPEEERYSRRRAALALPRGHQSQDDDEDEESNKENVPPNDDEELRETEHLISFLLGKLEKIIDRYQEQVSEELNDLKRKLKTRQS